MIRLENLDHDEYTKYWFAIRNPQLIRYTVTTLDQDDDELGSLTLPHNSKLISGQRDITTDQPPSRTLTLDVLDPHKEIALHPLAPSEGGVYMNRFIRVERGIFVQGLSRWIDVPIFYGPVTKFTQDQEQTHIEAQGKELLFLAPHLMWTVKSFKKGEQIVDVMRAIMREKGQQKFDFPEIDRPLPKHLSVARHQEPWPVLLKLAHSLNRQLFFDGRGVAKLRQIPHNPQHTFKDGKEGTILVRPSFEFDHTAVRNIVEVLGPKPSGKKQHRIRSVARLAENNPLSPEALAWNDQPRYMIESVDIDAPSPPDKSTKADKKAKIQETLVHRQKYADELSKRKLKELSMDSLTVQADVLPMADLEELDVYALEWDGDHFEGRLKESTLPFHSENMTIGYLKRVPITRRKKHK